MTIKAVKPKPIAAGPFSASKDLMVALEKPPEYEPDGGPLDEDQLRAVRANAAEHLPKGRLVSQAALFEPDGKRREPPGGRPAEKL